MQLRRMRTRRREYVRVIWWDKLLENKYIPAWHWRQRRLEDKNNKGFTDIGCTNADLLELAHNHVQ
jgi:hypothetical protein